MLTAKDVREWFEAYAVDMGGELNGGGWDISGNQLDLACADIAQAHEWDKAEAIKSHRDAWNKLEDEHLLTIRNLQAQLECSGRHGQGQDSEQIAK